MPFNLTEAESKVLQFLKSQPEYKSLKTDVLKSVPLNDDIINRAIEGCIAKEFVIQSDAYLCLSPSGKEQL